MSDIHKLSGAYALDALDDFERARFDQHLSTCDDCRAEVSGMRETAALLAETTTVAPPASLRVSVLAGISQVRPLPPETRRPEGADRRWFPLLVAAALVIITGLGALAWQPWSADESQLSATEQVLQADDAKEVTVDLGEAGRATVVRSKSVGKAVIKTEDMASAPSGKVYELWLESADGVMVPAGLMPDKADQTVVLEGDAANAKAAGITVEPAGGSTEPTLPIIAVFDFSEAV